MMLRNVAMGINRGCARKGWRNPNQMIFVFQDITNWEKGTEHINGLELFFKDREDVTETWERLTARKCVSNSN